MDEDLRDALWCTIIAVMGCLVVIITIAAVLNLSAYYALERCIKAKETGLNLEECKEE